MKSRAAFEHIIGKMARCGAQLYFWTFTFRDIHSLQMAMGLWNEFLTLLKRGGKAFWSVRDEYVVALEVQRDAIRRRHSR